MWGITAQGLAVWELQKDPFKLIHYMLPKIRCFYLMLESCPPESVPLLVNNLKAVPDGLRFEEIWNFGLLQIDNLKTHLVD